MPSRTVKPGISRIHATPHLKTAESATNPVTNIAAYRFAELSDLKPLRQRLMDFCKVRALKGTILLSTEGVNLFVAGRAAGMATVAATYGYLGAAADTRAWQADAQINAALDLLPLLRSA